MKKIYKFIRNNHENIYKIALFIFSAIVLVFILPKQAHFQFEFNKGKPWLHNNLIAPFDVPIYKSEAQLELEKQEIIKNKKLYFIKDAKSQKSSFWNFQNAFNEEWKNKHLTNYNESLNSDEYKESYQFGIDFLTEVYAEGIIASDEVLENKPADYIIYIVENNIEEEIELKAFNTIDKIESKIKIKLSKRGVALNYQVISNAILNSIKQDVFYDAELTEKNLQTSLAEISLTEGMVQKDTRIISKGDLVDDSNIAILNSFKRESENMLSAKTLYSVYFGQFLMVGLFLFLLMQFIYLFRIDIFHSGESILFFLLLITIIVFTYSVVIENGINIYVVPICIVPIVLRVFFNDTRVALFTHVVLVMLIGYFTPNPYQFVFRQVVTGIIVVFSINNLKNRSQFFITSVIIFVSYAVTHITLGLIQEGWFTEINYSKLTWFWTSSVLTLLVYPLIFVFERVFKFVSDITLLELSDTNNPLLKELAKRAPGTFQHSLQVANLAEAAVEKIKGNSLLVRAGALYHDIGKIKAPYYFIENQHTDVNPHDDLSFEESSSIIIEHVIDGIELAKSNKLPDKVIDFIRTHHGTSVVLYFYHSYIKNYPDEIPDKSRFTYPGPLPYSKETAVLMMADSVEASSRSIKHKTIESIDALVNKIIDTQMADGQYSNSNITFRDIKTIKKIFKKMLMDIHHVRIEY